MPIGVTLVDQGNLSQLQGKNIISSKDTEYLVGSYRKAAKYG